MSTTGEPILVSPYVVLFTNIKSSSYDPSRINFVELYNTSKLVTHALECSISILYTDEGLFSHLSEKQELQLCQPSSCLCSNSIKYRHTMFHSTQARLTSLDKRIHNLIQLSYNLVTQQ